MIKKSSVMVLALLLSLSVSSVGQNFKKWQVFELSFKTNKSTENPYLTGLPASGERKLSVQFTGTEGEAKGKNYTVNGFWDGGQQWKARFAAPYSGTWKYTSVSADPSLHNKKGTLRITDWTETEKKANPARRGFIYVADTGKRAGRHFVYADGTPFLWIADTWWNWTKRGIHFSTFTTLADDRASKGFTVGQLFVAGNGWGRISSLLDSTYSKLDIRHMQRVDSMIAYANSKGITVWIHAWWSRKNMNESIGEEKIKRWWRYLNDRLGAYNVIWVGAGEYNLENYGGFTLDFWKGVGQMIKQEDPYTRIVGYHPTPPGWSGGAAAPQWSTGEVMHAEPWLDYHQSQPGHGKWRNEMIPQIVREAYNRTPAKPIVITEPWYEFTEGSATDKDIRFGAWSAFLSGAAGHTYGGGHVWLAHVPEAPGGGGPWPLEKSFDKTTLDYPGAVSMGTMTKILSSMPWWKLEPQPDLIIEYPERYCAALPGERYLVYLRYGGAFKINLEDQRGKEFSYQWINPLTGRQAKSGKIKGGEIVALDPPGDYPGVLNYQDWLVHVWR
jgi:hypothetical protein